MDILVANVVAVIIAMARSLRAAVIGLGANNMDDDRRIIIDRIEVMIIYKFWG